MLHRGVLPLELFVESLYYFGKAGLPMPIAIHRWFWTFMHMRGVLASPHGVTNVSPVVGLHPRLLHACRPTGSSVKSAATIQLAGTSLVLQRKGSSACRQANCALATLVAFLARIVSSLFRRISGMLWRALASTAICFSLALHLRGWIVADVASLSGPSPAASIKPCARYARKQQTMSS